MLLLQGQMVRGKVASLVDVVEEDGRVTCLLELAVMEVALVALVACVGDVLAVDQKMMRHVELCRRVD